MGYQVVLLLGIVLILSACSSIIISTKDIKPPIDKVIHTSTQESHLESTYMPISKSKGQSGAININDGYEALLHRIALIRNAKRSIELQTYIYGNDIASKILAHEMWEAANRGVRVRILIDDIGLRSDFANVIAIDTHENIEVRIFNPFRNRSKIMRLTELMYDFSRLNHRMHNKQFIVDDTALIIGGRNIEDKYFDNNLDIIFSDSEVVFLGLVAKDALDSFNAYWDFHRSIPVSYLPYKSKKKYKENVASQLKLINENQQESEIHINNAINLINKYRDNKHDIFWGEAKLVADAPTKIENKESLPSPIIQAITSLIMQTKNTLYLVSAYLVPGKEGLNGLESILKNGVEINVLTNSLSSTDALAVYGAWERYRNSLVRSGANVYEYKSKKKKASLKGKFSSQSSLHSKVLVFDDEITLIGSFNLDGRSSYINTESMVIFKQKALAKQIVSNIKNQMRGSWKLHYDKKLYWIDESIKDDKSQWHTYSPNTGILTRILGFLSKILPEKQI